MARQENYGAVREFENELRQALKLEPMYHYTELLWQAIQDPMRCIYRYDRPLVDAGFFNEIACDWHTDAYAYEITPKGRKFYKKIFGEE